MGFIRSLVVVAAASIAVASPLRKEDVEQLFRRDAGNCADNAEFVTPTVAGTADYGTAFCETDWDLNFAPITSITTYSNQYNLLGIRAGYADGSAGPIIGNQAGAGAQTISVDYAQGDRFTGLAMYFKIAQYGGDNYITAIQIKASNGQAIDAGESPYERGQDDIAYYPVIQDIGSGFLMGAQGTADTTAINSLSFDFLANNVTGIQIDNFSFPDGPTGMQAISVDSLASAHYYNGQDTGDEMWTFENSQAIATTHTFTQMVANAYAVAEAVGITLMLPVIGFSSTTTFTWTTTYTSVNTFTYTATETVSWSDSGTIGPGQGVNTVAEVGHGQGTFPYTSQVTVTLADGYAFTFTENGALTIDDISTALVTVTSDNNPT